MMALLHRAAWVLPIAVPPIRDGWVLVEKGRILDLGSGEPPEVSGPGNSKPPRADRLAILPGLVNAHAHLELSCLRGKVAPARTMPEWVETLMALRRNVQEGPGEGIAESILGMRQSGTALVGDVTNTLASHEPLADSSLAGRLFYELLGFNPQDPRRLVADARTRLAELTPVEWLRASIVPHAPYSVSRGLFREIAAASVEGPVSVHVAESPEEIEFLQSGTGPWKRLLQEFGVWNEGWIPPGTGPVEFLDSVGLLNARLLAVHCVQLSDPELGRLAAAGATVVTCPRSNRWTGVGSPPIARFYDAGVRVAIGTDSLASVDDLNMFNEMAAVHALAPEIPASRILHSATLAGAEALGFDDDLGSIEPGKQAELVAVRVPDDVTDVEQYLVSGRVEPGDIRWLDAY